MINTEHICFEMIVIMSQARNAIMQAINESETDNGSESEKLLAEGKKHLIEAQQLHLDLIAREARGEKIDITLLMMHTEDQMITLQLLIDIAEKLIIINGKLCSLL